MLNHETGEKETETERKRGVSVIDYWAWSRLSSTEEDLDLWKVEKKCYRIPHGSNGLHERTRMR